MNRRMIQSDNIKVIQRDLKKLVGFRGAIDGRYGRATDNAVELAAARNFKLGFNFEMPEAQPDPQQVSVHKGAREVFEKAKSYLGTVEIKGSGNNPNILNFWANIQQDWVHSDSVPWCAAFVGNVLVECGYKSTNSGRAKSYLEWGVRAPNLKCPPIGSIIVFHRGPPGSRFGHVAFLAALHNGSIYDDQNNITVLGGNQSDKVCFAKYAGSRFVDARVHHSWVDFKAA